MGYKIGQGQPEVAFILIFVTPQTSNECSPMPYHVYKYQVEKKLGTISLKLEENEIIYHPPHSPALLPERSEVGLKAHPPH